ncbi:hypothetical protein TB2_044461 [Malus domestica]
MSFDRKGFLRKMLTPKAMILDYFPLEQAGEYVPELNLVTPVLGHLLHHFSWAPPKGVASEEIDTWQP